MARQGTAKELDEETGLYYYGARYLDSKYSMWISTDPALGEYIPQAPINDEAKKNNQNLPGMGGVFNHINSNLYHYAGNNPVKYVDPDGRFWDTVWDICVTLYDFGKAIYQSCKGDNSGWVDVSLDAASLLLPCVPAGLSKVDDVAKIVKNGDEIADSVKVVTKLDNYVKGAPVLGHYPEYIELAKKIDGKTFEMPPEIFDSMTKAEQWAANKKFLDRAIKRGESFNLATPLADMRKNSFYEEEVNYLLEKGYKLNEAGTMLIPGVE